MSETQASFHVPRVTPPIVILRRKWCIVTLVYGLSLSGAYWLLPTEWQQQGFARRWAFFAALAMLYLLWNVYQGLTNNHREDESTILPTLGLGNSLTLLRGIAIGLLAGFLFLPRPSANLFAWVPAVLYTVVIVLDYLDGYAARVTNHVTKLGATLDGIYDVLGFLMAIGLVIRYGQLSIWFLTAGMANYLFNLGLWWRKRHRRPVFDLPPSQRRRLLAGFQMGLISLLLWPLNYSTGATNLLGAIFILPVLVGFWRDWLVVSGRVDAASTRYLALRAKLSNLLDNWLPPLLRCVVVIFSLIYLIPLTLNMEDRQLVVAFPWSYVIVLLIGIAAIMLALGMLTRVVALGLLIATFMTTLAVDLNLSNGVPLVCLGLLVLLGGGKWSLWQADDIWVTAKAGE